MTVVILLCSSRMGQSAKKFHQIIKELCVDANKMNGRNALGLMLIPTSHVGVQDDAILRKYWSRQRGDNRIVGIQSKCRSDRSGVWEQTEYRSVDAMPWWNRIR